MSLIIHNLAVYSLQVAALVGVAALLTLAFRLENPRVRLVWLQAVLAACLLLPALQPWKQDVIEATIAFTATPATPISVPTQSTPVPIPWETLLLAAMAAGILLRLVLLAFGFLRLRRYLDRATLYRCPLVQRMHVHAYVGLSHDVTSPVTFGLRSPVVLFPMRFAEMDPAMQDAIACHELLHVARRDWLFTIAEELVRALLWFHPAIWWLLGEIQLTREQVVDGEVVRLMQSRNRYLEALLAIASSQSRLDLAPAPLFLRKRHLAQRVRQIVREVSMSRTRIAASMAALLCMLFTAGWLVVRSFPLQAQTITRTNVRPDAQGVSVELSEANLLHRAPVQYPQEAREKGIQGAVALELDLDQNGNVADARVLSGPQELRRAALESVLQWHYSKQMALPAKTQVTINFQLPQSPTRAFPPNLPMARVSPYPMGPQGDAPPLHINLDGVPESLRSTLHDKLAQYEGRPMSGEVMRAITNIVMEEDRHLSMVWTKGTLRVLLVNEMPPPPPPAAIGSSNLDAPPPPPPAADGTPQRIRVGGNVQQDLLISKVTPVYPPLAKQARIQGTVRMSAIIGKDGKVLNLTVVSGHPLLVPAAMESVQQWVYRPTLLNGQPVEVITQIDVNFTLSE